MPVYEYKALDHKGKNRKGFIDAESDHAARYKLRSSGKFPVEIRESPARNSRIRWRGFESFDIFERVSSSEVHVITRQLGTLLGAGISLIAALDVIIEQTLNPVLKKSIVQIKESVNEGATLTNALSKHPRLFSAIYVNMVRAGEASGSLDVVMERLADFGEKQQALKDRLRGALVYPVFMACFGVGILFILIAYVIPNITQVFVEMERALPLPTRFLIGMSEFLKQYWWLVVLVSVGIAFCARLFVTGEKGRKVWDHIKLRLPIFGPVGQKVILARFCSTLGSLLDASVPLITSMRIVKAILGNSVIEKVLDEAIENIGKGKSMTTSLQSSAWFPPMVTQMIAVGEQSGNLEIMLVKVADAYEREAEAAILGMTSLIEPLMIILMGIGVGFVVLSIILPILEMNQLVG